MQYLSLRLTWMQGKRQSHETELWYPQQDFWPASWIFTRSTMDTAAWPFLYGNFCIRHFIVWTSLWVIHIHYAPIISELDGWYLQPYHDWQLISHQTIMLSIFHTLNFVLGTESIFAWEISKSSNSLTSPICSWFFSSFSVARVGIAIISYY